MVISIPPITEELYEEYEGGTLFSERVSDAIERAKYADGLVGSFIVSVSRCESRNGIEVKDGEQVFFTGNAVDIWRKELENAGFSNYGLLHWVSGGDLPTIDKWLLKEYTGKFSCSNEMLCYAVNDVVPRMWVENEGLADYQGYRANVAMYNTHQFMAENIPDELKERVRDEAFDSALAVQACLYDILQFSSE